MVTNGAKSAIAKLMVAFCFAYITFLIFGRPLVNTLLATRVAYVPSPVTMRTSETTYFTMIVTVKFVATIFSTVYTITILTIPNMIWTIVYNGISTVGTSALGVVFMVTFFVAYNTLACVAVKLVGRPNWCYLLIPTATVAYFCAGLCTSGRSLYLPLAKAVLVIASTQKDTANSN